MLDKIRLRNLRSFSESDSSEFISIKPITILVGKNSSGKSTVLRSFPLLRQSVEAKKTGPILWYGPYVDFGSFSQAKNKNNDSDIIYFDFELSINLSSQYRNFNPYADDVFFGYVNQRAEDFINHKVSVTIGVSARENKTIAREVKIKIENNEIAIKFEQSGECEISTNNKKGEFPKNILFQNTDKILPQILPTVKTERIIDGRRIEQNRVFERLISHFFSEKIAGDLKQIFHSNTNRETMVSGAMKIGVIKRESTKDALLRTYRENSSFQKNSNQLNEDKLNNIHEKIINKNFMHIYDSINSTLTEIFSGVKYIEPLRATSERYYRYQDLQIDEIDSTGSNLAMVLRSLGKQDQDNFASWTYEHFGFAVRIKEQGLHCELLIETGDKGLAYNISDMGFGYSQMLPIITSIWLETQRKWRRRNKRQVVTFAIEQPELHLHPQFQSEVAALFCKVTSINKDNDIDLRFIIETHSKTIINKIGESVEAGILSPEQVSIAIFNKNDLDTDVSFSHFDSDGDLVNWPIGFFSGE